MPNALILDTCGAVGYVAVIREEEAAPVALAERHLGVRATQEELLPAAQSVLAEAGVSLHELRAIAVVSGPGSFTGVRIGLATAKGLCEAATLPLVTMSRLEVLADAASEVPVWAWLQAGRGEVYAALSASGNDAGGNGAVSGTESMLSGRVLSMEAAIAAAGEGTVVVCEEALRSAAPGAVFIESQQLEQALRTVVAGAIRDGRWADVALADALYLRVPDAELALRARQG